MSTRRTVDKDTTSGTHETAESKRQESATAKSAPANIAAPEGRELQEWREAHQEALQRTLRFFEALATAIEKRHGMSCQCHGCQEFKLWRFQR